MIVGYFVGIFCSFVIGFLIGSRFRKEEMMLIKEIDRKMAHLEEVAKEKGML